MSQYILAIDQGTTGSTASLVNSRGKIVGIAQAEFPQHFPKPGWVEHNPEEIWQSILKVIRRVMADNGVDKKQILAVGITNQRETVIAWDRVTQEVLHPAIVWQCRRTHDICERLKREKLDSYIRSRTGLVIDPYFSATKMQWLLKHGAAVKRAHKNGRLSFGTIDAFLVSRLTGGRNWATEPSNAARTQVYNIKKLKWDTDLTQLFGIPVDSLPQVMPSNSNFGVIHDVPGLQSGTPICGMLGDQQAALFGHGAFRLSEAKCTYGTGSFILVNAGSKLPRAGRELLATIAWQLVGESAPTYALEGGAFICGAAVQWLRDQLHLIRDSREIEDLARSVSDNGGVQFVPSFVGLGAPYWDSAARGLICGLTRGTERGHIARATLEAMALQNVDILHSMEKIMKRRLKIIKVDGGAAQNQLLLQLQADYMGCAIERPRQLESTVLGAAFMAGLGSGMWNHINEIKKTIEIDRRFEPHLTSKLRGQRIKQWHQAIDRVRI